jgi:GNAT superfamily N-acetyltransferase
MELRALRPELWRDLEKLFGSNGACGGCWCMYWRAPFGEKWDNVKGEENRRRFRKLVTTGKAHGLIAYQDGEPVGWCSFGRRRDYLRIDRSPSFRCEDADEVWSIPCFFMKRGYRRKGIGEALLKEAAQLLQKREAKVIEGYPVKPAKNGKPIPDSFAWTGTISQFTRAGFKPVDKCDGGKQRMRIERT